MTQHLNRFRAWNGERWLTENLFLSHDGKLWFRTLDRKLADVSALKVVRSTGHHDKNGVPIFEGDIVAFPDTESEHVDTGVGMTKVAEMATNGWGAVVMENFAWGITVEGSPETLCKGFNSFDYIINDYGYEANDLEVIGNVWENPEFIQSLKK